MNPPGIERTLGVAVIGLGVMGRTHIRAYQAAAARGAPCALVAVCSDDASLLSGTGAASGNLADLSAGEKIFDPSAVATTTDPVAIAGNAEVDLVSICTPTDSHAGLAIQMLRAGKHVLVEKPVAVTTADVGRVIEAAGESGRTCMPAMCMRFWPGWDWLKARIAERAFGRALSATFTRVGSRPDWSRGFYHNPARTGGAMFDLHVHDADVILHLFGPPRAVRSMGSIDHITTLYEYSAPGPMHVVAEGAWLTAKGFPFRMRYTVEFEHAVADWDLSRPQPLLLVRDGKAEPVALPGESAYDREVAHFVRSIADGRSPDVTLADALLVARLLEAEKRSLEGGRSFPLA